MVEEVMADVVFRTKAVERMQAGANVTQLARDLGVSRWALYRWKRIYEKQGPAGLALAPQGRQLLGRAKWAYQRLDEAAEAKVQMAELERKVGQQALQIDFLTRAFKRLKESRQYNDATGGTASTERSGQ
jgi:transposase-like protein